MTSAVLRALLAAAAARRGGPKMAVVDAVLPTSLGAFDVTVPGFGTPAAAIVLLGVGLADGTARANAVGSVGATDGAQHWSSAFAAFDSSSGSDTHWRGLASGLVGHIFDPAGNTTVQLGVTGMIAEGLRFDLIQNAGPSPYRAKIVLIGGAGVAAAAGTQTLAAAGAAVTVTPGFEASALFTASAVTLPGAAANGVTELLTGFAGHDGAALTQAAATFRADAGNPFAVQGDVRAGAVISWPTSRFATMEAITGTGFDLRSTGGDLSSWATGWLALAGLKGWAGVLDAPTATGLHDFTGATFRPVGAMLRTGMFTALDTNQTAGEAGGFGLGAMADGSEASYAFAVRDNVSSSDTSILAAAEGVRGFDHTGALAFSGAFSTFLDNGVQVSMSAADATTRKWPVWFLG
ncbi:MAG: hypothetical protein Tsb0020_46930 [Haliangiales bacterium]